MKIIVSKEDINKRLDTFLSEQLKDFSRSYFSSLNEKENILVNGKNKKMVIKFVKMMKF